MASSPCVVATTLSLSLSLSLSKTTYETNRKERERCVYYHAVFEYTNQILQSRDFIYVELKKKEFYYRCFGASTRHTVVVVFFFFFFFFFFSRAERVFDSLRGVLRVYTQSGW